MHTSLECSLTGEIHSVDRLHGLSRAGKPLLARYDLTRLKPRFTPQALRNRTEQSMWKFHEVLPVDSASSAISLGEGLTPLLTCVHRVSRGGTEATSGGWS